MRSASVTGRPSLHCRERLLSFLIRRSPRFVRQLFGRGIVGTVDNFGVMGDAPSQPELRDHLAATFVAEGWSVKKLVRRLVLSRAYQPSSRTAAENFAVDPANKLIWHPALRRLSAEEIRDAILASAGTLDL